MNGPSDPADPGSAEEFRPGEGGRSSRSVAAALKLNALLEAAMPIVTPTGVVLGFLFIALTVSRLVLPADTEAAAGFVLLFSAPTAVAGFIWVSIYRGDEALALALILLDTLAAPFVMPLTVSRLLGTDIRLDGAAMALSLLGVTLNEASRGRIPRAVRPYLAPLSKILLALVIAANSAAVAPSVDFSRPRVWAVGAAGIGLTTAGFLLGKALGLVPGIGPARRRGLVFTVGLRNISAVATIAIAFFPEAAALPAILGMFFQQTLAAIFGRILLGRPGHHRSNRINKMEPDFQDE